MLMILFFQYQFIYPQYLSDPLLLLYLIEWIVLILDDLLVEDPSFLTDFNELLITFDDESNEATLFFLLDYLIANGLF